MAPLPAAHSVLTVGVVAEQDRERRVALAPASVRARCRSRRPGGDGSRLGRTYRQYPAGGGFGGYKQSGYGREADQQTLRHYQEVKNVLVNHDPKPLGFFA